MTVPLSRRHQENFESMDNLHEVSIEQEMSASFMDYAMSVIIARALPDVRDGLKPVQRRISPHSTIWASRTTRRFANARR